MHLRFKMSIIHHPGTQVVADQYYMIPFSEWDGGFLNWTALQKREEEPQKDRGRKDSLKLTFSDIHVAGLRLHFGEKDTENAQNT